MGAIERIFFGVLALGVIGVIAVFFILSQDGAPKLTASAPSKPAAPMKVASNKSMTQCGCYEKAFLAADDASTLSIEYQTGYQMCRAALGSVGTEAWTAGWSARIESGRGAASCRAYLKTLSG